MKLFLILFFAASLMPAVKCQSSEDVLRGCRIVPTHRLICNDFEYSFLPYKEEFGSATTITVQGSFRELQIDSNYVNVEYLEIYSSNLQKLHLQDYINLPEIATIQVHDTVYEVDVDFTSTAALYASVDSVGFRNCNKISYTCESFKSSKLTELYLYGNNLGEEFDFGCVPPTMTYLELDDSNISAFRSFDSLRSLPNLHYLILDTNSNQQTIDQFNFGDLPNSIQHFEIRNSGLLELEGCESLRNLLNLERLRFDGNKLTSFDLACFPSSVEALFLYGNDITDINLSAIATSGQIELYIDENPIRCTCAFLRDYVQVIESGSLVFSTWTGSYVTCSNPELANYPWGNNAPAIRSHDASALVCLSEC